MSKPLMLCAAALTAFTLASCKGKANEAAAEPEIVLGQSDIATAHLAAINAGSVLTGSLQPAWIVAVKAQVPGTIEDLKVDRGVAVSAGQVLATIRAEGIRGQAEGARAGVLAAEAGLAVAKQRLESARTLREAGALSEIDLKAAAAGYEAAVAQVAAARAGAAAAGEAAGHATVRAPISGVVSDRNVEAGESVNPGQPLFTVVRADELELSGQVPIEDAAQIRPGQNVVFSLDAYPNQQFKGSVSRVEPTANTDTRQVGVYLRMRNPGRLVGGQFASGRIEMNAVANALVIPESAVRGTNGDASVLLIQNGRVVKRTVVLGVHDAASGMVQIRSGLQPGDIVLAAPGGTITDGARVKIASPSAGPTAQKD